MKRSITQWFFAILLSLMLAFQAIAQELPKTQQVAAPQTTTNPVPTFKPITGTPVEKEFQDAIVALGELSATANPDSTKVKEARQRVLLAAKPYSAELSPTDRQVAENLSQKLSEFKANDSDLVAYQKFLVDLYHELGRQPQQAPAQPVSTPQTAPQTTSPKLVGEFTIIGPAPEEKSELTDEQMEILLGQLFSPLVRSSVIIGTYDAFKAQYNLAKTRSEEEAALYKFNRDAQALRNAPIVLTPASDVEIVTPPADVQSRRWQEVKEWGVVQQHRMGDAIDCREDPYEFTKARTSIIKALVERAVGIPGFDTAHKASFLHAFDECMKNGPDGACKLGLATDHPYSDWGIGGQGPAFNLHYVPDPNNERAVNAKSLSVYDEMFGDWYDVGCACGGNISKISGTHRKIAFTSDVSENYVVCSRLEVRDYVTAQAVPVDSDGVVHPNQQQLDNGMVVKVVEESTGPKAGNRSANWTWMVNGAKVPDVGEVHTHIRIEDFAKTDRVTVSVQSPSDPKVSEQPEKVCSIALVRVPPPPPTPIAPPLPPKETVTPPPTPIPCTGCVKKNAEITVNKDGVTLNVSQFVAPGTQLKPGTTRWTANGVVTKQDSLHYSLADLNKAKEMQFTLEVEDVNGCIIKCEGRFKAPGHTALIIIIVVIVLGVAGGIYAKAHGGTTTSTPATPKPGGQQCTPDPAAGKTCPNN